MNFSKLFYGIIAVLASCSAAAAGPDFSSSIPICSKLQNLPKNSQVIEGCEEPNLTNDCEFLLIIGKQYVIFSVEKNIIIKKSINFLSRNVSVFGIKINDNPKIVRQKLKKYGVNKIQMFDDADGLYMQSKGFACDNNNYSVYITYSEKWKIQEISISTLPYI
jgi:hypothetical protein